MNNETNNDKRVSSVPKHIQKNKKTHHQKRGFDYFLASAAIFLFFCVVIGTIIVIAVSISLRTANDPDSIKYTFSTVNDGKTTEVMTKTYSLKAVNRNGEYFAALSDIADFLGMRYVGDSESITLTFNNTNEYITFYDNSQKCSVNGVTSKCTATVFKEDDDFFAPINTFSLYCDGFSVNLDSETMNYTITYDAEKSKECFTVRPPETLPELEQPDDGSDEPDDTVMKSDTVYEFVSDLSEYEKYMNPDDSSEYIILVNPENPLDSTYVPAELTDLVDTRKDSRATQKMRLYAAKSLEAFLIEARANGIDVTVTSGYRSYAYQNTLFTKYTQNEMNNNPSLTKEEAEKKVSTYSCRPGTSEHQSGLCIDMHNQPSATQYFANTKEAVWLAENCYKFGFILRFPKDKQEITNIIYEPWHFRYVGRYHAEKMNELNLCLEEYVELLSK